MKKREKYEVPKVEKLSLMDQLSQARTSLARAKLKVSEVENLRDLLLSRLHGLDGALGELDQIVEEATVHIRRIDVVLELKEEEARSKGGWHGNDDRGHR